MWPTRADWSGASPVRMRADSMSVSIVRLVAVQNLALRRNILRDEPLTEPACIHGEARQRIDWLLDVLEDAGEQ
jgi:hypothetical protein